MDCKISENANVSLHDCRTNRIIIDKEYITFCFPDGFYIIDSSISKNNCDGKVKCHLLKGDDCFNVFIFRKDIMGRVIRKDYTDKFVAELNEGKFEFEFVYTYRAYQKILFKGYIWQNKNPYDIECEIDIQLDEITYSW